MSYLIKFCFVLLFTIEYLLMQLKNVFWLMMKNAIWFCNFGMQLWSLLLKVERFEFESKNFSKLVVLLTQQRMQKLSWNTISCLSAVLRRFAKESRDRWKIPFSYSSTYNIKEELESVTSLVHSRVPLATHFVGDAWAERFSRLDLDRISWPKSARFVTQC